MNMYAAPTEPGKVSATTVARNLARGLLVLRVLVSKAALSAHLVRVSCLQTTSLHGPRKADMRVPTIRSSFLPLQKPGWSRSCAQLEASPVSLDHFPLLGTCCNALRRTKSRACANGRDATEDGLRVESATDDGVGDVRWKGEEGVGKVGGATVVRVESRDELGILTANIHHGVHRSLREDCHLARLQSFAHGAGTILSNHVGLRPRQLGRYISDYDERLT
jgi:hypothetical protein